MFDTVHKWLIILGDLFGIFCFTFKKGCLSISKVILLINATKICLVPLAFVVLSISAGWDDHYAVVDYEDDPTYSTLLKVIEVVISLEEFVTGLFVMIVNILKRKSILRFLNRVEEVPMQEKHKSMFKSRVKFCLSYSALLLAIVSGVTFGSAFKHKLSSFILFVITMAPYLAEFTLLVVIKVFEIFFITLLEEFRESLDLQSFHSMESFLSRFDLVVNLSKEFRSVFGLAQTFTTVGLAVSVTTQVAMLQQNLLFSVA